MPRHQRSSPAAGFTLVEALIALAILGGALLLGMEILLQQTQIQRKLRAHQEAHAALGRALEAIRAGTVPLVTGPVTGPSTVLTPATPLRSGARAPLTPATDATPAVDATDGLDVRMTVDPDPSVPGLARVLLVAHYTVRGQLFERRVETMVWRRP